jgi:hypothetical protein
MTIIHTKTAAINLSEFYEQYHVIVTNLNFGRNDLIKSSLGSWLVHQVCPHAARGPEDRPLQAFDGHLALHGHPLELLPTAGSKVPRQVKIIENVFRQSCCLNSVETGGQCSALASCH